jgi:hypothetical protein
LLRGSFTEKPPGSPWPQPWGGMECPSLDGHDSLCYTQTASRQGTKLSGGYAYDRAGCLGGRAGKSVRRNAGPQDGISGESPPVRATERPDSRLIRSYTFVVGQAVLVSHAAVRPVAAAVQHCRASGSS